MNFQDRNCFSIGCLWHPGHNLDDVIVDRLIRHQDQYCWTRTSIYYIPKYLLHTLPNQGRLEPSLFIQETRISFTLGACFEAARFRSLKLDAFYFSAGLDVLIFYAPYFFEVWDSFSSNAYPLQFQQPFRLLGDANTPWNSSRACDLFYPSIIWSCFGSFVTKPVWTLSWLLEVGWQFQTLVSKAKATSIFGGFPYQAAK